MLEGRVASLEGRDQPAFPHPTSPPLPAAASNGHDTTPSNSYTSPERGDGTSDLSSRVGMLDFWTTQMEHQYLGSSSAFAFSRIINLSLSRDLPIQQTYTCLQDRRVALPSPCLLPEYDVALALSSAYFKTSIHSTHFCTNRPLGPGGLFCLLLTQSQVYAVAALLSPNTQSLAEQLYKSAQLYTDVLSKDNIESIQALLCYAMYSLRSLTGPSLWKLTGLALRQCIELGYHRTIKRLTPLGNPLQQEMRKRVFWVAHGIDCAVALRLGRPLGIPLQEINAEFPSDVDDSSTTEMGISSSPRNDHRQPSTPMSTAIHVFKLRCIWARIHTSLFSDTSRLSVEDDAYHDRILQLWADLDN
ncbi:hypothetical protein ACJZ2D_011499 [Fusarium nematophilum]